MSRSERLSGILACSFSGWIGCPISCARSFPKSEDQTEGGMKPVVVLNNGFCVKSAHDHHFFPFPFPLLFPFQIFKAEPTTYIHPKPRKPPRHRPILPSTQTLRFRVHSTPTLICREKMLQSLDDERGVAVDVSSDC